MPRRNRNAHRTVKARGDDREKDPSQPRVKVEDLILPDGQCTFQGRRPKARFGTKEKADRALAQAQKQRARVGSGHVEKRVYKCPEGGCGGYHLTSREVYEEKRKLDA